MVCQLHFMYQLKDIISVTRGKCRCEGKLDKNIVIQSMRVSVVAALFHSKKNYTFHYALISNITTF